MRVTISTTFPSCTARTPVWPASSRRYASSRCVRTSTVGGGHVRPARPAEQDAFPPGDLPGHLERLGVPDPNPIVNDLAVERLGHVVLANPLDLPRLAGAAGQHRPLRVGRDDLDVRVLFL